MAEKNPRRQSAYEVYARNTPKQKTAEEMRPPRDTGRKNDLKKTPKQENGSARVQRNKRNFEDENETPVVNGGKRGRGRPKRIRAQIASPEHMEEKEVESEEDEENIESVEEKEADEKKENVSSSMTTSFDVSSIEESVPCGNKAASEVFRWLLNPVKPSSFFDNKFDKKPLLIQRSKSNYYKGLFSSQEFNKIIKENSLEYNKEIDIVAYISDERITLTNDMKVHPNFVWKSYQDGYSIRMRNPQVYHKQLWKICSLLQEYFSSFVGVNMYLTPAASQGFPPHYDDIDAFILQIEGKKRWKLYKPRDESEQLARYSSSDLAEEEIGKPCMDFILEAGDMLYFPRGYIHQAMTTENEHSLHLTISSNQLNTWGDLLQSGIANAVERAVSSNVEFRKSLPKDYLDHVGFSYSDSNSDERKALLNKYHELAQEALKYLSMDHAADEHSINFIHSSMPPFLSKNEESCSIHGNGNRLEKGEVFVTSVLMLETKIRWIRKRAFRLVMNEEGCRLFHSLDNSKSHKEDEAFFLEIDSDVVPAINVLFQTHPAFIKVKDLPINCKETKLSLAQQLYDNGFLMTEKPLPYQPQRTGIL